MTADTDALLRDLNRELVRADVIERDDLTLTQVDISVVMPCLNEEDSVALCVEHALEGIRRAGLTGEVVVCDNGSTDASVSRAAAAGARVVHQPEKGYGSAYRKGFDAARGRILVMGDSDGSYDFSQLDRLVAKLDEGYDYVLGSRFAGTILPGAMPWLHRYVGNPALTGLLNLFFGLDTSDAHSGMRAFSREAYDRLGVATEGMEFASEIVINAAHAGLRVAEVPITYHPRTGESKLNSWRDGWRHLRFMLLLAPNWLFVLPGTSLFLLGTIGEIALLPGPLNLTAERTLGVHFSVLFTLMAILGYQQLMFGVFTKAYARNRGSAGRADRLLDFVDRTFSLERGLVVGLLMFLIGAGIDTAVLVHWLASHMGSLDALRPVLLSLTLMTLGAQTAFGSFFLSLFHRPGHRPVRKSGRLRTFTRGGDVALAGARISAIVLTAASSAVVARTLGPQQYGVFAAGTAVATLMVLGKAFGADALYLRGSIDGRTLQRRAVGAGLVNLAVVAVAALAWPGLTWTARGCELLMGGAWALAFARIPWQVVPARHLQFAGRARRELLGSVLSLGGVIVFAAVWQRPLLAAAGLLAGTIVTTVISWPAIRRERTTDGPVQGDASVRAGLRFTAIEGLFVAYFALGGALIAAMRPAVDAGTYRVAFAFVVAAAVVPVALNADVLRVRLWRLSGVERAHALRRAVLLTAAAAVVVTLSFELLGGTAERLFFGTKFTAAIAIIRILGAAMPFHYANSVLSNMLVGAGRITTVIRVQVAMLVTNLVTNLVLIPSHGPKGAAVATVITEVVGVTIFACVVRFGARYSEHNV